MFTVIILPNGGKVWTEVETTDAAAAADEIAATLMARMPVGGAIIGVKGEGNVWHKFTVAGSGTTEFPYRLVTGPRLKSHQLLKT